MTKKTGFVLVGCGKIARKHAFALHHHVPEAEIVAFVDREIDRAQHFSSEYGPPAYSSIAEMMRACGERVDIVNILTPSGAHYGNVLELVSYGKPLVVEKPLTLRLEDADRMIEACDLHGAKLFVVHQNRYNPAVMLAYQALRDGRFGKLVLGTVRLRWMRDQAYYDSESWRGTWKHDGGVFMNQALHHIDMLRWFMGPVESVRSMAATRLVDIECEDTGVAVVRFVNGALGVLEATTATRPKDLEGSISILGQKGAAVLGGYFMNELTTWQFEDQRPEDDTVQEASARCSGVFAYNLGEYLKDVIRAVQTGKAGLVDGMEARRSLELVTAIYESIETGEDVYLRFQPRKCRLGIAG